VAIILARGLPQRLDDRATILNDAVGTNFRCSMPDYMPFGGSRACAFALPSRDLADADVALIGNSHAQMYAPVWKKILDERGLQGILVPLNSCLPTPTVNTDQRCAAAAKKNLEATLALPNVRIVVIGTTWLYGPHDLVTAAGTPLDNRSDAALQQGLDAMIDRLRNAGKAVVLIGPIPEPGWQVASILSRDVRFNRTPEQPLGESAPAFDARFGSIITHFKHRPDIGFALPHHVLCDARTCHYVIDGRAVYADDNHLARAEVWRFRRGFEAALDVAVNAARQ
jgi:hypothetical protein